MDLFAIRLPYLSVYIIGLIISGVVLYFSYKNRKGVGTTAFIWSVLLEVSWLIGYIFEIYSPTLQGKIFWDKFQWIGALFAPITLLIFSLQFTGRKTNPRKLIPILSIIPLLSLFVFYTNIFPQEYTYANARIISGLPFDELTYEFGKITNITNYFLYAISFSYLVVLISGFFKKGINRQQLAIVLFGTAIPTIGIIFAVILDIKFANQRDVSPLMFVLSNVVMAWGILRYRLFNIVPVALEILFENIHNLILVLDQNDFILDANPAAAILMKDRYQEFKGLHISEIQPELYKLIGNTEELQTEITDEYGETFSFAISPLHSRHGTLIGRLINANNITAQKKVEAMLQATNEESERRALQLQAIAEISQSLALLHNLADLLPAITEQISQKFNFYHVGIFLLDSNQRMVVLQAANSKGGRRMVERGHQLAVGQVGIVGRVALNGISRIALDVGLDPVYFDNPDLPATRSEIAIPLIFNDKVIGVLDVQSKREKAFTQDDVNAFETLANQVTIAIENARQFERTKAALNEAEALARQYIRDEWGRISKMQQQLGYRYTTGDIFSLSPDQSVDPAKDSTLKIPVKLRGETIGIFKIRPRDTEKKFGAEDLELIQAIANRAALAMENARLLEESQRRASREQAIGEFSASISAASNVEAILKTAVEELGRRLPQFSSVAIEMSDLSDKEG